MNMRPIRIDLTPPFVVKFDTSEAYDLCEVRLLRPTDPQPLLILQASYKDSIAMETIANRLVAIGEGK